MRGLLGTYAIMIILGGAIWATNGFPSYDTKRLGIAGLTFAVIGVLVWLRWDVGPAMRRKRLEEQSKVDSPPV